jgi:hypothetical protein
MFAKQKLLGLVDLGGEIGRPAPVGMHLHHEIAMGAPDVGFRRPGVTPSIS